MKYRRSQYNGSLMEKLYRKIENSLRERLELLKKE